MYIYIYMCVYICIYIYIYIYIYNIDIQGFPTRGNGGRVPPTSQKLAHFVLTRNIFL